jgi:hypothetical protein
LNAVDSVFNNQRKILLENKDGQHNVKNNDDMAGLKICLEHIKETLNTQLTALHQISQGRSSEKKRH